MTLLLVAIGSGMGGAARYSLASAVARRVQSRFPWGTFIVNITGCFLIGVLFGLLGSGPMLQQAPALEQAAAFGFLGGYTTFSTYSIEAVDLFDKGQSGLALGYVLGTLATCVIAVILGFLCVR